METPNVGDLWRSLDKSSESLPDPQLFTTPNRRDFLRLMGASLALAGATACSSAPPENIVPYVRPPEQAIPGKPLFFATAMPLAGYGIGLIAESHLGRPTKVDGNPFHPASLGA